MKADAIYLFGQTKDNERSTLETGSHQWTNGNVKAIALLNRERVPGYPGFRAWEEKLVTSGVPEKNITGIRTVGFPSTTFTEAEAIVIYAQKNKWQTLYISTSPFHQLRAFVSVVSVIFQEQSPLLVYNIPGKPLPWNETVSHSLGVLRGTRVGLIQSEIKRLNTYHQKGNLVSAAQVLAYLEERDRQSPLQ